MLELLDEIGREEIRVLQEISRNMGAHTSSAGQLCAIVRCHDLEGRWHDDGATDVVECSSATLSRIEALGLVQSAKGQGYEESRGPDFSMEVTARCKDFLSRKVLVWLASRFSAKANKWIAAVAGILGIVLGSIDMLYRAGKTVVEVVVLCLT